MPCQDLVRLFQIGTLSRPFLCRIPTLALSSSGQFRAAWSRCSALWRRRLQQLGQFRPKLVEAILLVAELSAVPGGTDSQKSVAAQATLQSFDDSQALGFREGTTVAHIETQLHPSVQLVYVLATGTRAAIEAESELGYGDLESGINANMIHWRAMQSLAIGQLAITRMVAKVMHSAKGEEYGR
jgi:hypothetical protein